MLKNVKKLSLFLLLLITLFSCERDNSTDEIITEEVETYLSVDGYEWVLSHGYIYFEALDYERNVVFDYFSEDRFDNRTTLTETGIDMDVIALNNTKWFFDGGFFTLNDGEPKRMEEFDNGFTNGYRVLGLGNGTSRVVQVLKVTEENLKVKFNEAYTNIPDTDGVNVNVKYWSELTFTKEGYTCDNCWDEPLFKHEYVGVFNPNVTEEQEPIVGTKWRVDRYSNVGNDTFYPNDIIEFTDNGFYLTNGGTARRYTLSNVLGNNNKSLTLYGFTTLGGDYSGQVINTFVEDGVINNASFYDILDVNKRVTLWMTRIE